MFHANSGRVFFIKFPLAIRGIERNVAKYIYYTGVFVPLVMTVGHIAEYFVQPRHTLSPVYTFMRDQTVGGINEGGLVAKISVLLSLAINVVEFAFYVIFFLELSRHKRRHRIVIDYD